MRWHIQKVKSGWVVVYGPEHPDHAVARGRLFVRKYYARKLCAELARTLTPAQSTAEADL